MKINTFHDLFIHKIQTIYDAEHQIVEAVPTIIEMISNEKLKSAMNTHLHETQNQIEKIEKLCDEMNIELEGVSSMSMEGLIEETLEFLQDNEPSPILDAAIIAAAQEIEHFEISAYGSAAEWAKQMDHDSAKQILGEILIEEKKSDQLLTELAESIINKLATEMSGQIAMGRMG